MTSRELIAKKQELQNNVERLRVCRTASFEDARATFDVEIDTHLCKISAIDTELLERSKRIADVKALQAFILVYIQGECQSAVASKMGYSERWLRKLLCKALRELD